MGAKMKKLLLIGALAIAFSFIASETYAQTTSAPTGNGAIRAGQEQLIGEITSIDAASGQMTIKTDAGRSVSVQIGDETIYLRIAPGERSLDKAEKITRADVAVGDRVLVRGGAGVDGQPVLARQLIVVSRQALAGSQERNREDWRRRGLNGRIVALNPATKEVTVAVRSREGAQEIIMNASGNTRWLRYAPDSVRRDDAQPSSFAELKIGDQLRALGDRSSDGTRFTPEEIIAGSFARTRGTIVGADAAKGEVTIKDEQTGKSFTVVFGKNSTLRRVPPEFVETLAQRRAEREQRRAAAGNSGEGQQGGRRENRAGGNSDERERGARPGRRGGGGGGGQMFENLPTITIADLRTGDVVMVTGTPTAADASRITTITLVTGDAALMKRLQQLQGQGGGPRNMSPGLPGDVIGGGTSERERP